MVARLAALPWRQRFGETLVWILLAVLFGGGYLLSELEPVEDGNQHWESAIVTGFAPEVRIDGGSSDLGVDVILLLPSGAKQAFLVDAAEASRCHVGQRVRLRIVP